MTPTQADREDAAYLMISLSGYEPGLDSRIREGRFDTHAAVECIASFRLAAEAAAFEKAAAYIEGKGGVIPGATVFISLITGSNQPCMSGDGRDHLHSHKRRQFDDATSTLATAIRKLAGEKHD